MTTQTSTTMPDTAAAATVKEGLTQYWPWMVAMLAAFGFTYFNVFAGLWEDWSMDENYSHGFLVPLVSGYFLYTRREKLLELPFAPSWSGLALVLLGLLQFLAGHIAVEYFTMRTSLIPVLSGLIVLSMGWRALMVLALPVLYLAFMIPVPYILYNAVSFSLKLFVTEVSVAIVKAMGVVVWNDGNILNFPDVTLEVADACSGMRSLISLGALGVAFAYIKNYAPWQRIIIMASSLPIAVATNICRVVITGLLCQYVSPKAAEGYFHEFAGITVFGVALALLFLLGSIMDRLRRPE